MAGAIEKVIAQSHYTGGYVCFANTHVVVMAREDPRIREVINRSFMTLPDGKPVYLAGRLRGITSIEHIPGPDFFLEVLAFRREPRLRHYFYGGKPEILESLMENLKSRFPQAEIVGGESPPFRELTQEEITAVTERIRLLRPDIIWVGLGAPKQEFWMASHWEAFRPAVLLGVGAAFDFYSGAIKRAPVWMQKAGLEWLHRLLSEPGRLWKRYIYTNSMFLFYSLADILQR